MELPRSELTVTKSLLHQAKDAGLIVSAVATAMAFLGLTLGFVNFAGTGPGISVILAGVTLAAGSLTILYPPALLLMFLVLCMTFPHELESTYFPLSFMKVYAQDVCLLFLGCYSLLLIITGRSCLPKLRSNRLVAIYLIVGLAGTINGLWLTGHAYTTVLGDFRRAFLYMMFYFIALILIEHHKMSRNHLLMAFVGGGLIIILKGYYQIITGAFAVRRFGDAAHILNHFEVTFSLYATFTAIVLSSQRGWTKWIWIMVGVAGTTLVALANFRTCWVGMAVGLGVLLAFSPRDKKLPVACYTIVMFIASAFLILAIWKLPVDASKSTIGDNLKAKSDIAASADDINIQWRLDSYNHAFQLWKANPILGRGLGQEFEFVTATSTGGSMMAMGHRVHNSYLWFITTLGIIGFSLIIYVYLQLGLIMKRAIHGDTERSDMVIIPAFLSAILTCACFDVYLESSSPPIVIAVAIAVGMFPFPRSRAHPAH